MKIPNTDSFKARVEGLIVQIPEGRVMTYGQIAALVGSPRAARQVGGTAHFGDPNLPWHRVVNKSGGLASGYPGGRKHHGERLKAEGYEVQDHKVDVGKLIWWPSADEDRIYKHPTVFIVGPTASGKSELAMRVAKEYDGEIICADSQTIRRGLDIGTAKPKKEDRTSVVHHMLDVIEPYDRYSVAEFKTAAQGAINEVSVRGKLSIVVGGTGLYVDALLYDFQFRQSVSGETRLELEALTVDELQAMIKNKKLIMPENNNNTRHLIRTIESDGQASKKGEIMKDAVVVGLNPGKEAIQSRIQSRIQKMLEGGFLDELDRVIEKYGRPPEDFDAISYKIALEYRTDGGEYYQEKIAEKIAVSENRYAKRQMAWFKRNTDVVWFEHIDSAYEYLNNILQIH